MVDTTEWYNSDSCGSTSIRQRVSCSARTRSAVSASSGAQALFAGDYIVDRRSDDPEQFRAIGWVSGALYSVIYEVRQDEVGEFYHLVTLWKSTREEQAAYAENISETD